METTIGIMVYWDNYYSIIGYILGQWKVKWKLPYYNRVYTGITENKMETTVCGSVGGTSTLAH